MTRPSSSRKINRTSLTGTIANCLCAMAENDYREKSTLGNQLGAEAREYLLSHNSPGPSSLHLPQSIVVIDERNMNISVIVGLSFAFKFFNIRKN